MQWWGKKKRPPDFQSAEQPQRGVPTVKFDPARVTKKVKADLLANVNSLSGVDRRHSKMIYEAALRSITAGGNLSILFQALMTIDGMNRGRAEAISRSLHKKADALMTADRQLSVGIKYAVWVHSGAPCGDEQQDAAHRAANQKRYRVEQGLSVNGVRTRPGREDDCRCISKSLVPGLDYEGGEPEGLLD